MTFDITYDDELAFNEFAEANSLYKDARYVFTFDNRFWVYYYKRCNRYVYIAVDSKTGYGSEFISTELKYKKSEFDTLIGKILYSIKYTGELRYLSQQNYDAVNSAKAEEVEE